MYYLLVCSGTSVRVGRGLGDLVYLDNFFEADCV
jgi:hypothetical protein